MAVARGDAMAVIDHDGASVASEEIGEGYNAIGRRDYRRTHYGGNVDSGVECAFPVEGIDALPERAGNLTFHGPEIGRGIGANPVGGGGVFSEAERDAYAGSSSKRGVLQRVKLIKRRIYLRFLNLFGGCRDHCRIGFEPVEGGDFTGQRAQRGDLNITLFRYLFQA